MLTAKQCMERAAYCDERASESVDEGLREQLISMGKTWRHVAFQAEWQDAFVAAQPSER
jgi:O-methyltransferase involved in polyketide biosynthesis